MKPTIDLNRLQEGINSQPSPRELDRTMKDTSLEALIKETRWPPEKKLRRAFSLRNEKEEGNGPMWTVPPLVV